MINFVRKMDKSDQNVSRETFWSDWDRKSYKAEDAGHSSKGVIVEKDVF